jgi:hypothetical protein
MQHRIIAEIESRISTRYKGWHRVASMETPVKTRRVRISLGPLVIVLLCGFTVGSSSGTGLTIPVPLAQGGQVIAVGDFNGDGRADLAVAGTGVSLGAEDSVSILLGQGDGTFSPGARVALAAVAPGVYPEAIVVGDFDGDGRQDVAVATAYTNAPLTACGPSIACPGPGNGFVSVLLGAGDGTLGAPKTFQVGVVPVSMAIGDFNGDGHRDLAVANVWSKDVSILIGLGDGTFAPQVRFTAGYVLRSIAAGDFNGDGHEDLVLVNGYSNDVSVLLGLGNGAFGSETPFAVGAAPRSVAVGDFNGDGRQDLAVANSSSNDASILLGHGDGTFATQVRYAAGEGPSLLVLGDFNDDGRQDLAVGDLDGVAVLPSRGDGTFDPPIPCGACGAPFSLVAGRFDGDGHLDLAAGNLYGGTYALLGRGDGFFVTAGRYEVGYGPVSEAIGDFNGDGRQDLVVVNDQYFAQGGGAASCAEDVSILLGRGDGTFEPEPRLTIGTCPNFVAVGDFDGDGRQDLVLANGVAGDLSVVLGRGDGSFGPEARFGAGVNPVSIAVGDLDGDGRQDLAVANEYDTASNGVSVLLGRGDGTFAAETFYAAGSRPRSVGIGDLDGDGRSDLVVANLYSNDVSVLLGRGDGTFGPQATFAAGALPVALAIGDWDGDGRKDVAVANASGGVSVLLGHGDGSFDAPAAYDTGGTTSFWDAGIPLAVGDLDGDGRQDLAVADYQSSVSVLLGHGDGTFGAPRRAASWRDGRPPRWPSGLSPAPGIPSSPP